MTGEEAGTAGSTVVHFASRSLVKGRPLKLVEMVELLAPIIASTEMMDRETAGTTFVLITRDQAHGLQRIHDLIIGLSSKPQLVRDILEGKLR